MDERQTRGSRFLEEAPPTVGKAERIHCSKQPHLSWQYAGHIFRHSLHPPDAEALGAFYFIVMTDRKCDGNVCSGIPGIDQTIVRDSRRGI